MGLGSLLGELGAVLEAEHKKIVVLVIEGMPGDFGQPGDEAEGELLQVGELVLRLPAILGAGPECSFRYSLIG